MSDVSDVGIQGGCYCGDIRYRGTAAPIHQAMCNCANCRRAAGAQSVAWVTFEVGGFSFVKGEPTRYRTETAAWRTFCPRCGTSLTYEADDRPNDIDITVGSLDQPEDFPPNKAVFAQERLAWDPLLTS